ncbi:ABC transporter ATP-binding protein [Micromonospora echinospora]|uniref:ABC transporter ATP-binding protein n=1 Tax=Micromonospora echinospora TaxID=1877 RepID=UPI00378BC3E2
MNRLDVRDLRTYFFLDEGIVKAVDGVSLHVGDQETVGVIGESGCGKTAMAHSLLRLTTQPGEVVHGNAMLTRKDGSRVDILALPPDSPDLLSIRGNEISMVFQEPMTSFSPVHTIGFQIGEMLATHTDLAPARIRERVVELMARVGISNPRQRFDEYPHQLSGGMRQRAMIAMALAAKPKIIIADEPTTALDVTVQAQILDLLKQLQREDDMSALYITHNLGIVAEEVDRVYVMYLGRVVETVSTDRLFARPLHPYTQKLLRSVPQPGRRVERLDVIEGSVPVPIGLPVQCGFYARCPAAMKGTCDTALPALTEVEPGHQVRCFLYGQETEPNDEWTAL